MQIVYDNRHQADSESWLSCKQSMRKAGMELPDPSEGYQDHRRAKTMNDATSASVMLLDRCEGYPEAAARIGACGQVSTFACTSSFSASDSRSISHVVERLARSSGEAGPESPNRLAST
jgi:hypothetical protein